MYMLISFAFPAVCYVKNIRLFYFSIIQSFAPTLHPPFLGEAGISSNDYYLLVYSLLYRTGFDRLFVFLFLLRGRWGISVGFPPRFLKVAARVKVATADDKGRGRIPVGLGCAMGIGFPPVDGAVVTIA